MYTMNRAKIRLFFLVENDDEEETRSFAELLGPDCVIKRVDKDRNVISSANPDEMQKELMTRASAQKRLGACADHVQNMNRQEKLDWALEMKDQANALYTSSKFDDAAKLYNDCLVALDLEGSEEEKAEVATRLQLPVCTNLAACMIEMGRYGRCIEICNLALSVDSQCPKALYRRGLAHYRLGDHSSARPDFEAALRAVRSQRDAGKSGEDDQRVSNDLERRLLVYLGHVHRFHAAEKSACQKMFAQPLYADRPDPSDSGPNVNDIDDSDEAIDEALARIRGDWRCCRRAKPKTNTKEKMS